MQDSRTIDIPVDGRGNTAMALYNAMLNQLVAQGVKSLADLSAGSLNADLVAALDVSSYKSLSLQLSGTWSGTLTLQGSNDGSNWVSVYGTGSSNGAASLTFTSNQIVSIPVNFRYFRVRMTSYSSGTATGTLLMSTAYGVGSQQMAISNTLAVTATGNVANNTADSGNPVKVGGKYNATPPSLSDGERADANMDSRGSLRVTLMSHGTTAPIASKSSNSDAQAVDTSTNHLAIVSREYVFNGTSWDRMPGDTNSLKVEERFTTGRATADTQIKGSAGFLHAISIAPLTATPTAGKLTVYDSTSASGTVVYEEWVFATAPGHTIILDRVMANGIYIDFDGTLANVQVTASYR